MSPPPTGAPATLVQPLSTCGAGQTIIYDTISNTTFFGGSAISSPFTGFCMPTRWRYAFNSANGQVVYWQDLRAAFSLTTPTAAAGAHFTVSEAAFLVYVQTFGAFSAAGPGDTLTVSIGPDSAGLMGTPFAWGNATLMLSNAHSVLRVIFPGGVTLNPSTKYWIGLATISATNPYSGSTIPADANGLGVVLGCTSGLRTAPGQSCTAGTCSFPNTGWSAPFAASPYLAATSLQRPNAVSFPDGKIPYNLARRHVMTNRISVAAVWAVNADYFSYPQGASVYAPMQVQIDVFITNRRVV
jgi:hypothetical protein